MMQTRQPTSWQPALLLQKSKGNEAAPVTSDARGAVCATGVADVASQVRFDGKELGTPRAGSVDLSESRPGSVV